MMRDIEHRSDIIRNFSPAWFASVMGTGVLAITLHFYAGYFAFLDYCATAVFYFNVILFFVLLVPWILRWLLFRNEALADLKNPVMANFYPTAAIAMAVLAADFTVIGGDWAIGAVFWVPGVILTIFFSILIPYVMFTGEHVKLDHINPAWFIPPVALIIIPMSGSTLMTHFNGAIHETIMLLNYFGWGAGFFMYLGLFAIALNRFILHKPIPSIMGPTVWINIGPIGAGIVALYSLVGVSDFITVKEPFIIFGMILWAFGLWWVIMAIVLTLHYKLHLKMSYAMSWWAFTFPLGAYVAATHLVSVAFGFDIVDYIGFGLNLLLIFLWAVTLFKTGIHAYHGTLFRDASSNAQPKESEG